MKKTEAPEPAAKQYPRWFYAIPVVVIIAFFLLLEAGLRVFHYGETRRVFVEFPQYPGYLVTDFSVARKYFPQLQNIPTPIFDLFHKDKSNSTLRIFVLGESSAAGWPYTANASFSRYLKRKLQALYPEKDIEVINMGISAICTYTIRDILPEILQQRPDAILVYTGHNEYYGALGAGSTQRLGHSRWLTNFLLKCENLKTFQLVQNIIRGAAKAVGPDAGDKGGNETLMAKVIGESAIPLNSDVYQNGLSQFEGNMRDIIAECKAASVPVVISTLACNLQDQKPFVNIAGEGSNSADSLYTRAKAAQAAGNVQQAKQLFEAARDRDALRFRAPSAVNQIIRKLAAEFSLPLVEADTLLNAASPTGIAGKTLMVDHLHPTITGYALIGEGFYKTMQFAGMLPPVQAGSEQMVTHILQSTMPFTSLDSTVADLRVRVLTGTYPFVPKGQPNTLLASFRPVTLSDTLAQKVADHAMSLEEAHYRLADMYLQTGSAAAYENELRVLIEERPMNPEHYKKLISGLIELGNFSAALVYLQRLEKFQSDEFTNKWIGSIAVNQGDYTTGVKYLERYVQLNGDDPQAWYNLAGAYANSGNYKAAIEAIRKSIRLAPQYGPAIMFYQQLMQITQQK
ncbi:MAG: tetratricopeptide repeat protein [Ignavibacteria bacterium]|nr:tetratricopeptide repeat protein [Ignavibacteria bacterium]